MAANEFCYLCLTNSDEKVAAVTTHHGTALCEKCAKDVGLLEARDTQMAEIAAETSAAVTSLEGPR